MDYSRTDPVLKQCRRWKEKGKSTASQVWNCPICSAFLSSWSLRWNWSKHEAGKIVKLNFSKPFSCAFGRWQLGKIYSPRKALFFKEAKAFCIFNMHPINHCLWLAILASAGHLTTWIIFTLASLEVCYLQVLFAYIINRNNFWDDLVKRPAA